jgi:hypothetical protein
MLVVAEAEAAAIRAIFHEKQCLSVMICRPLALAETK